MVSLRATVKNGRLVVDTPTDLPEGTVIDLVQDDEGDDLDAAQKAALESAIAGAWEQAEGGQVRPANAIIDELRARR